MTSATLPDGSVVSFHAYGAATGQVVFALHGTPASGAGFAWADTAAATRGVRLLAPDRPGVGGSSPARQAWTVAEYPARIAQFADALGIVEFGVWGYSGGGPYAAACAALLPERVTAAVVSSGMGQIPTWATRTEFASTDRQLLALAPSRPRLAALYLRMTGQLVTRFPKLAMKSVDAEFGPADRAVFATFDSPQDALLMVTDAVKSQVIGVVHDYTALAGPWGFDVADIRVPFHVFHGDADQLVPLRHGRALAAEVPGAVFTLWPGEGHLGSITHVGQILDVFSDK